MTSFCSMINISFRGSTIPLRMSNGLPPLPSMLLSKLALPTATTTAESFFLSEEASRSILQSFSPFRKWLLRLEREKDLSLSAIQVQSVDFFGPRIGFMKLVADITRIDVSPPVSVPGVVFLRGSSVAVLVVIKSESASREPMVVVTRQARVPASCAHLMEIPAGMMDDAGCFAGKAAEEIHEETGITLNKNDMVDLTAWAYESTDASTGRLSENEYYEGVWVSPGGSDESIRLFAAEITLPDDDLAAIEGRIAGVVEDHEHIVVRLVPLRSLWKATADAKALCALALYNEYCTTTTMKGKQ
eukprot:ANDGO_03994.mRNA.1 hypothetical protein